jgi:glycosyltransferase involved in cell wall biosynthesis
VVNNPKIIVAIPAYNEEIAIGSVVARCKQFVDTVFVIDDGSTDHTVEVAKLVGAEVVQHKVNGGYGSAIQTCFELARSCGVDAMIIIDADGQHNPDDIPTLIAEMKRSNSDIVIGSRFINGNGKKQSIPAYRKVGMKVLDTATGFGSGLKITDSQSGYRLYSRKAINSIRIENKNMAAGSEILIQAADLHFNISEIPILVRYDIDDTSSKNPISHGFDVLNSLIRLISQRRPMTFFGLPGVILMATGLIFIILAFNMFNATRDISLFYTIGAVMCILLGIFSIFTGLILSSIQSIKVKTT